VKQPLQALQNTDAKIQLLNNAKSRTGAINPFYQQMLEITKYTPANWNVQKRSLGICRF
jgi:hypothetical protein